MYFAQKHHDSIHSRMCPPMSTNLIYQRPRIYHTQTPFGTLSMQPARRLRATQQRESRRANIIIQLWMNAKVVYVKLPIIIIITICSASMASSCWSVCIKAKASGGGMQAYRTGKHCRNVCRAQAIAGMCACVSAKNLLQSIWI